MKDQNKTKEQLLKEIELLKAKIAELEKSKTEPKLAEDALRKSEELYRDLVEKSGIAILIDDREGNLKYFNKTFTELFGYSAEEMEEKSPRSLVHPEDVDLVIQFHKERLKGRKAPSRYEFRGIRKDGSTIYLEVDVAGLKEGESFAGTRSYIWDITERKQAEETLRESEEKYKNLVEITDTGYLIVDGKGFVIDVNEEYVRLTGHKKLEDVVGKNVLDWTADYDLERNKNEVKGCFERGFVRNLEIDYSDDKGKITPIEINANVIESEEGKRILTLCRDITERKRVEEAIEKAMNELETILNNTTDVVFQLSPSGTIKFVNPKVKEIFGYEVSELMGKHLKHTTPIKEVPRALRVLKDVLSGKALKNFEIGQKHKNGNIIITELNVAPIKRGDKIVAVQGIMRDITERKQAEERIKEKTLELKRQIEKSEEQRIATLSVLSDLNKTTEELQLEINIRKQTEETLLKNEFFLSEAQRISSLGSYELDVLSGYWTNSDELNTVFGIDDNYDRSVEGWENIMHPEEREDMISYLTNDVLKEHNKFDREYRIIRVNDNEERWVHGLGELEFDDEDNPVKMIGTIQDITERKLAEEEIRKLSHSVEQSPAIVVITNTNGNIEYVNPKFEEITGYTAEEVIGKSPNILKGDDTTPEVYEILWKTIKAGGVWHGEFHNRKKNGELYWESASISGIKDRNEQTTHFIAIKEDITERKAMEQRIRKSRNQLRSLAERLQMIREEERASIAREIHDDLGQTLTALKMDISWMKKNPGMTEEVRAEKINTMLGLTDSTIQTVKRIATELRPGILDDLGLIPAIEWETEEFRKRSGIKCNLEISVEEISVEDSISIAVFRIFQESLTNIARHSGATKVEMTIKSKGNLIQMEITDNGVGITEEQMRSPKSLGLMGMNERVSFFGGKLAISKSEKGGTTVMVYIPIVKAK